MPTSPKIHTIKSIYKGREYIHTGTLQQLIDDFSYRLECNNVKLSSIKSIKSLMRHLNEATDYWSNNSIYVLEQ